MMTPTEKLAQLWSRAHCPQDALAPALIIITEAVAECEDKHTNDVRRAVVEERKACAKVAEGWSCLHVFKFLAAAIRDQQNEPTVEDSDGS